MAGVALVQRLGTAAIAVAGVSVIALMSGVVYEQSKRARDREQYPQIGRSVDIDGRALNIYCSGNGNPSVILESGARWAFYDAPKEIFENGMPLPGYSWVAIQRELARITRACWYDRAGSGWSDLGPYPRDSASQARDLHALLGAAGIPGPYLFVAESSAALDARVFTGMYPSEVAGLVLVDGAHPHLGRRPRFPRFVGHSQDVVARLFNQIGLYRLGPERPIPQEVPKGINAAEWTTIWHLAHSSKARSALIQDISAWEQSTNEAQQVGSLGERPMIVLSSASAPSMELQRELAQLSTRGKHVIIREARDNLIFRAPGAIVGAVREVLERVRQ
jgi:pimeloyl-ACP methyl ester carboxylesterase